jgi:hypothetical protein
MKAACHLYSLDPISEGQEQVSELFEASVIGAGRPADIDRVFHYEDVAPVEGAGFFQAQVLAIGREVRDKVVYLSSPHLGAGARQDDTLVEDERSVLDEAAVRMIRKGWKLDDLVTDLT